MELIILLIALLILYKPIEGFYHKWRYPHYCNNCNHKSKYECSNCIDCGLCIDQHGYESCTKGNHNRPYFKYCAYWKYNYQPYRTHIYPTKSYNWPWFGKKSNKFRKNRFRQSNKFRKSNRFRTKKNI